METTQRSPIRLRASMQRSLIPHGIVRADMPTTDDIAINKCEDPHLTSHQGGSEYLDYHFICDALFNDNRVAKNNSRSSGSVLPRFVGGT